MGAGTPNDRAGEAELVGALEPILDLVAEHAPWANEHRRPHPEVFAALASAGLLRLIAPGPYGGHGVGPGAFLSVIERLAEVDGSTAWTAMTINEEVGIASSYLPPATMTELLASQPDVIIAGSGVALGRARPVDGGWRIEGRWRFVSGSPVADRIVLASRVERQGEATDQPRGPGRLCFALIPADQLDIEDTWHTAGLRGTGSNDVVADGVVVPERWVGLTHFDAQPLPPTPYYCLPSGLRFPWPKVGVAVGLARRAIAAFDELARSKKPSFQPELLAERPNAQAARAQAEALVGSGRAWVDAVLDELWSSATGEQPIEAELHARARLSASSAVDNAIRAVEGLASAAGTSAGTLDGPWPRLLADVRAVGQHFMVGPQQIQTAGRVLLGQPSGDPSF